MALSRGLTTRRSLLEALRDTSNNEAWSEFLRLYQPLIVSWCLRLGMRYDAAEELCAEIVGKLVVLMRGFVLDPQYRFRGWLKTVVTHGVYDYWRERGREPTIMPLDHPMSQRELENRVPPPGIEEFAGPLEDALQEGLRIAERVRQQVSPKAWQAFWLTAIGGERARAVSERLGMTVAAVYTARSRVARLLREEGSGGDAGSFGSHPDGAHS